MCLKKAQNSKQPDDFAVKFDKSCRDSTTSLQQLNTTARERPNDWVNNLNETA